MDGTIPVVAGDWPTFLYARDDQVYDINNTERGLTRGILIVRVRVPLSGTTLVF
jgi:hypothetical protein